MTSSGNPIGSSLPNVPVNGGGSRSFSEPGLKSASLTDEQIKLLAAFDEYSGASKHLNRDKVEEKQVRTVVRDHVWDLTKFLKSEGSKTVLKYSGAGAKRRKLTPVFGDSHERPDLTKGEKCGYPYIILFQCGKINDNTTMEQMAEFWVTWEEVVRHEMQLRRAAVGRQVKATIRDMLINGTSKKAGSYQIDCYRLQVFKETLNEPLNRRIPISESSSGGSEEHESDGSSSENTAQHYSEDEKRVRLQEREKRRMEENKRIALELVKLAAKKDGLINVWDIFTHNPSEDDGGENEYSVSRGDEQKIFWMFVDTCVVHMVPKKVWKENHINFRLSEYIKPSNEAFAMLILENIAPDLVDANGNWVEEEVTRKLSTSRYTKGGRGKNGRMKGWRTNGIVRYNKLVKQVLMRRKLLDLKMVLENELRKHYKHEMEQNEEAEQELNENEGENSGRFTGAVDLSTGGTDLSNEIEIPQKYANIKMVPL